MRGCPERNGVVHSIHQLTSSFIFSNFSMAIQEGQVNNKSVEYLVATIHIFWIFDDILQVQWYFPNSSAKKC
jgi:hypothetical protein